eukprot:4634806-Amphidinium_carterae.1
MDTQSDSDLLEPDSSTSADVVPGQPAVQLGNEQIAPGIEDRDLASVSEAAELPAIPAPPEREPGIPARPQSFPTPPGRDRLGKGCHLPCTQKPDLQLKSLQWDKRLRCLDQRKVSSYDNDEWLSVVASSLKEAPGDRMTVLLEHTTSTPHLTTVELSGVNQFHKRNGNAEFMLSSTWQQTYDTKAKALGQSAMPVDAEAAEKYRSPSAFVAKIGLVTGICLSRLVWIESTLCALHIQSWKSVLIRIWRTCANTGRPPTCKLLSQGHRLDTAFTSPCQGYRQIGWTPITYRIGEARMPGPTICSTNPGGWSLVEPDLNLKHDVVAVQETFVLRDKVTSAKFIADKLGYYSSFTPARKTEGRPRGGLALLCRKAQPLQRMEKGTHWELGRWAHHLLPYEQGLHVFNVYGYSSDKERAQELNREVCLEIFAAVAALGNRQIFILGDWNFEPDNFPIDLVNGGQINRPLSEVTHTSPTGELQLDWILCSKALMPSCGMEQETGKKPDHVAISLEFRLDLVSQGYRGQKSYETAERTDVNAVAVEYGKARKLHQARWSTALAAQDVEQLWALWCRAAEQALGLPANSRGSLRLSQQQLLEKVPDEEAVATAQQQDTVELAPSLNGRSSLGNTHPLLKPNSLNSMPGLPAERKDNKLSARLAGAWRAYVKEMWNTSPKKIYKWIRGTAAVWDLAILSEEGYALSPDQATQAELEAWSKLWQPGNTTFPAKATSQSSWGTGDLRSVIRHCPLGKARGVDRWSIAELWLLPEDAIADLANFLKAKERAKPGRGARSPYCHKFIDCGALYAGMMYEAGGPGAPVAAKCLSGGALDETFDLAFDTEQITAAGKPQAGVFLDCSKCYERIPLNKLEAFALESGYPLYALYAALDMYAGRRRVLLQGAVSEPVTATHGMPPGCGHAVDLLHAFLLKTLKSAGRHVSVRKYVDDMVLVASGPCFAGHLCYAYRQ